MRKPQLQSTQWILSMALAMCPGIALANASTTLDTLRLVLFWISLLVIAAVSVILLVALIRQYRVIQQHTKPFHSNLISELAWAITPLVILVILIWPTIGTILAAKS